LCYFQTVISLNTRKQQLCARFNLGLLTAYGDVRTRYSYRLTNKDDQVTLLNKYSYLVSGLAYTNIAT